MVGLTLERRLRGLETLLGVEPGRQRAADAGNRALAAVEAGTATLADFQTVFAEILPVIRASVVVRSQHYREGSVAGQDLPAFWPSDVAAKIIATPLSVDPDPTVVDLLVKMATRRIPRQGQGSRLTPGLLSVGLVIWQHACLMLVALGSPDGRGLRHAVAEGHFDDAMQVARAFGLYRPLHPALWRVM